MAGVLILLGATNVLDFKKMTEEQLIGFYVNMFQNTPFTIKGMVVDLANNPIDDGVLVFVTKERMKQSGAIKRSSEEILLKSHKFTFDMANSMAISLLFKKDGYYSVKKNIDKGSKQHINKLIEVNKEKKKNVNKPQVNILEIKIVLRKIHKLPDEELLIGDTTLSYEKSEEDGLIQKGWLYKKDEDGDILDSVNYKKTSEVDLYVERDKEDKTKLYLVSNRKDTGFILQPKGKDLTYLSMAPEDGYKQKIPFKVDLYNGDKNTFFAYWKLNGKLYGKMEVTASLTDRTLYKDYSKEEDFGSSYTDYSLNIEYFLNPSGARNVTTTYDD